MSALRPSQTRPVAAVRPAQPTELSPRPAALWHQPATTFFDRATKMTATRRAFAFILLSMTFLAGPAAHAQEIPADPSAFSRSSAFEYDPASGLLTSETVEPGNPALCVKTSYAYDAYGNRTSATTKNCDGAAGNALFQPRTSGSEYLASVGSAGEAGAVPIPAGTFASKVSNALQQSESRSFDPRYGMPVSLVGPNQLATSWQLDQFGRTLKEVRADGTTTVTLYCYLFVAGKIDDISSNNYNCGRPNAAEIPADAVSFVFSETRLAADDRKIGPFSRVYMDAAGRKLRTVTEAFDGSTQKLGTDRRIVQDTDYNFLGGVLVSTQPYFLDSSSSTAGGGAGYGMSTTVYDELGRPTDVYVSDPKGKYGSVAFGARGGAQAARSHLDYQGMTTVTTNDWGKATKEEKNVDGKIGRVTDARGAQIAHQYDAFGNLLIVKDALQNAVVVSYDIRGRKRSMNDPDAGKWTYDYNALGELVSQQSPNQLANKQFTTMEYDLLGRMTKRVEPEYTSTWYYDKYADASASCGTGVGKLCETQTSNGVKRRLVYDRLGRLANTRVDVSDGPSFTTAVGYDGVTGRPVTQTYPTGLAVKFNYTAKGFLSSLTLAQPATVSPLPAKSGEAPGASVNLPAGSFLWQGLSYNAWGRAEQQIYGNNVVGDAKFDPITGRVEKSTAGVDAAAGVMSYSYEWDSLSRVETRTDANGNGQSGAVSEKFGYDEIGRLLNYDVAASAIGGPALTRTVTFQHNAVGSILFKSDVGVYAYKPAGTAQQPHALQSVSGAFSSSYTYDDNGNLITSTGGGYRKIGYTSFNLPDSQSGLQGASGGPQYTWQYDESHQRIKELRTGPGGTRTTWMLHPDNAGGLSFESEEQAGVVSNRHYLSAGGVSIGVLVTKDALPVLPAAQLTPPNLASLALIKVEYWHKDHLGSLAATTDHAGAVTARYSYDPFGKRRFADGNYDADGNVAADWNNTSGGTDRGYTGHEHLDDVGVIHMNGRIYDPRLGVFMQTDPFIQDPTNLQNLNRYGYCYNNPMTCTDPSGQLSILGRRIAPGLFNNRNIRVVASIAAAYFLGPGGAVWAQGGLLAGVTGNAVAQAAIAGFVSGTIASGNIKGGIQGAFSSMVFFGAGKLIESQHIGTMGGIAVHGVAGCITSEVGGGACGAGALSASFTKASSGTDFMQETINSGDRLLGTMISALVGGTGEVLGGGKFRNGAFTGAFSYLFNDSAHPKKNGRDPYDRHAQGVLNELEVLQSQGFALVDFEVPAVVAGLDYGRRYDIVVRNIVTGELWGVEVKTSLTGVFRLDPKQVAFDAQAIAVGAETSSGLTIRAIMYRGECTGCGLDAIYRSWKLVDKLVEKGVVFQTRKPPIPGR